MNQQRPNTIELNQIGLEQQKLHDVAHHTLRIRWLEQPDAQWADGIPVSNSDKAELLRQSRSFLAQTRERSDWTQHCGCNPRCVLPASDAEPTAPVEQVRWVSAKEVRVGDVLRFGDRHTVLIERVTQATSNGDIGLHGNNDTWTGFYRPENRVRIAVQPSVSG